MQRISRHGVERFETAPRIRVGHGKMQPGKKYRGRIECVISQYVRNMMEALLAARENRVFIIYSGCPDEQIAEVREYLEGLHQYKDTLIPRAGSVVSSHYGPGTLGVLFIDGR